MSASELPVQTIGTVREVLSESVCLVELPNGKVTHGHLARALHETGFQLAPGARLRLELTPYDFSKARIAGAAEPNRESS